MPHAIHLNLDTRALKRPLPSHAIPAVHANVYQWIEQINPDAARLLDAAEGAKPFTTSPLMHGSGDAWLRLTALDDTLLSLLLEGLDRRPFVRIYDDVLPIYSRDIVQQTYQDLMHQAGTDVGAVLRFDTPLSFTSKEMDYLLPDPVYVFSSYLDRWNAFAPEEYRIDEPPAFLDWVRNAVGLSRFELRTESLKFSKHQLIGCVGQVQYRVIKVIESTPHALKMFNVLADYAFFCGTGRKTTQGMGQTTRLNRWQD